VGFRTYLNNEIVKIAVKTAQKIKNTIFNITSSIDEEDLTKAKKQEITLKKKKIIKYINI